MEQAGSIFKRVEVSSAMQATAQKSSPSAEWEQVFGAMMDRYGENYRVEFTTPQLQNYREALGHLSVWELAAGLQRAMRECKFLPNVAEILAAVKACQGDAPAETRGSDCAKCGGAGWWKPEGADRVRRCGCRGRG